MLSPITRSQLNFNTATVSPSTHFLVSPSSSSSPSPTTSKHKHKSCTGSSSLSVLSSSQFSSLFSFFIVALFSYFMCQSLVSSTSFASSHNITVFSHSIHTRNYSTKENLTNDSTSVFQDMPQNDQPPRSMYPSYTVPEAWTKQSQYRFYYLRAENDQFLQFYGNSVTGTKLNKPALGLMRFLSHQESVVIMGVHEEKYLCMNETYALYMSDKIDPECYIHEESLLEMGSQALAYEFIKYRTNRKLYLGINCDPMLGTEAKLTMKSTRFSRSDISDEQVKQIKMDIKNSGPEKYVKKKCERVDENKLVERQRRQKLRNRWCWNLDRIIVNQTMYLQQCKKREGGKCDKRYIPNDSEECVCDVLSRMLANPRRTKRKCLVEKLTKWVENQNSTSNSKAIMEASKLLLRSYSGIARRMRTLKTKQNIIQQEDSTTPKLNKHVHPKLTSPKHRIKSKHPTSTQSPQARKNSHQCHEGSSKTTDRKHRHHVTRINCILEQFRKELILTPHSASTSVEQTVKSSGSPVNSVSSSNKKRNEPSVLSKEFKNVLNSLSNTHPRRHKAKQRKRKGRKPRRLKDSKKRSDKKRMPTNSRYYSNSGTVVPG